MGNKRLCLLELAQPSVEPPCIPRSGAETICDRRIKNALDSGTIAASSFLRLLNFAAIMKEKEEIPICAKNAQIFLGLTIDQLEKLLRLASRMADIRNVSWSNRCFTVRVRPALNTTLVS